MADMQVVQSLQAARFERTHLLRKTVGSQAAALTGVMFGAIGGAVGAGISVGIESSQGKKLEESCSLPDFSTIVFEDFINRLQAVFPDWPKPVIRKIPPSEECKPTDSAHLLVVRVFLMQVDDTNGLMTRTCGKIVNPSGETVWEKGYVYKSSDFSRPHSLKDLEAENGKLLKQEIALAAEKTVSDLILHLKGAPSVGARQQLEPAPSPSSPEPREQKEQHGSISDELSFRSLEYAWDNLELRV